MSIDGEWTCKQCGTHFWHVDYIIVKWSRYGVNGEPCEECQRQIAAFGWHSPFEKAPRV